MTSSASAGQHGRPRTGVAQILGYALPELHNNRSGCYVDYYARHPRTGELKRVRMKLNRIKSAAKRQLQGRLLVQELSLKLQAGWTPWNQVEPLEDRVAFTLEEALDQWQQVKTKQTRHSSPYSYSSMGAVLLSWARERRLAQRPIEQFTRAHAMAFLNHLSNERGVANATWNNYRVFGAMVFGHCEQRGLIKDNPFKSIRALRSTGKSRTYLTEAERAQMVEWICQHDPDFLLPCVLIFGALIRPGEVKRLRVSQVDLQRQVISLPAEVTKTGVERTPAIPNWMMPYLYKAKVHLQTPSTWLVGSHLEPGGDSLARNTLNRHWSKMRAALRWPSSKQLYSLRDTGIIQLLRDGVDLLHVMQQAGHTEIGTTNKYLKHAFPNGPAEVREMSTSLLTTSAL
jgi:integrase